jgi:hypothetical protein
MFLDIAFGIFASYVTANFFDISITWQLICLGIFFNLLPDIDFLWKSNQKIDHRGFMHYPLYYVIATVLILLSGSYLFAFLFFITTLFHFVHDTFVLGWGVAWLAPFSYRRYKLFPDDGKGEFLKEKFLTWLPEDQEVLEKKLDDKHWIQNWYCRFTIISFVEYTSFLIAVLLVIVTFVD